MIKNDLLLSQKNFKPFLIGSVDSPVKITRSVKLSKNQVVIKYPSRLNAMAIDPSQIAVRSDDKRRFKPGEVVFIVDLFAKIKVRYFEDGLGKVETTHKRSSIIRHSAVIMKKALGFKGSLHIDISGEEYKHTGLGSSGRIMAGVASAINELFQSPINPDVLIKYLAQNHGEEIDGNFDFLMPVQCIGGSASAGLFDGACKIITGESTVVCSVNITNSYYFVIGWPSDFTPPDAQEAMFAEFKNIEMFYQIGKKHGDKIAYRILHEMFPALRQNDFYTVGNIIEWYRFELGSIKACSFTYPNLEKIGQSLLNLRRENLADIVAPTSVGPGFFALTKKPDLCKDYFENLQLTTIISKPYNSRYKVI